MKESWEYEVEGILKEGRAKSNLVNLLGISPEDVERAKRHAQVMRNFSLLRIGIPFNLGIGDGHIPLTGYKGGYDALKLTNSDSSSCRVLVRQPLNNIAYFRKDPLDSLLNEIGPEIKKIASLLLAKDSAVTDKDREFVMNALGQHQREDDLHPRECGSGRGQKLEKARLGAIGYYVGAADAVLAMDGNIADVVAIYKNAGVLYTGHVKRKLRQYSARGSSFRAKLVIALHKYSGI